MPPKRPPNPKSSKPVKPVKPATPAKPVAPPAVGDTIEIDLEDMAQGGATLGRYARKIVFVPYGIPGERVRAKITRIEENVLFAEGTTLLAASADRVLPKCPHFGPGRCRGCQWQH